MPGSNEIVGVSLNLDAGNVNEKVEEIKDDLKKAELSAAQISKTFGDNSKQAEFARERISKLTADLKSASDAASKMGTGLGKTEAPIKSMRTQLREALYELIAVQEKFGDISPEAQNAAKKVAELKDRIKDAREVSDLFDPEKKFQAVVGAAQGIASGFAAAQGAMNLFGVESKEVEGALLKVQAAMALSQGLSAVKASVEDFQRLKALLIELPLFQKAVAVANTITAATMRLFGASVDATSVSFVRLRAVIAATGIGLLVIAIGVLIQQVSEWATSTEKATEKQKKFNEALAEEIDHLDSIVKETEKARNARGKNDNYGTAGIDQLNRELAALKARGASASEVFNKEQEIRKQEKENLKIQGQTWVDYYAQRKKQGNISAENEEKIRDKINDINKAGQDKANEMQVATTAFNKEEQAKRDASALASLKRQEDIAIAKAQAAHAKEAQIFAIEDAYGKLREGALAAAYAHDRNNVAAREALLNEQAANEQKRLNRSVELNKEILGIRQEIADEEFVTYSIEQERELRALGFKFAERIKAYEKAGKDTAELVDAYNREEAAIVDKYESVKAVQELERQQESTAQEASNKEERVQMITETFTDIIGAEKVAYQTRLDLLKQFYTDSLQNAELTESQRADIEFAYSQARKQIARSEREVKIQEAQAVSGALDGFAQLAGEQTAAGKAFAVASATIQAILGAQQAFTALSAIPIVGPALGAVAAAGAIAAGIANVKKILAVQIPGGAGGGSAPNISGMAPIAPNGPQSQFTKLDQDSINNSGNATVKAIVVESDITNNQERINRIQNQAVFK